MLDELLFKLHLKDTVEYETAKLFEKSKEEFVDEVLEMSASEKAEMLESHGKVVDETFEDGGRWSNHRTRVFKFLHNSEYVFISVSEEVPATEIQDSGDFGDPEIEQVYPHKVETTVYKTTKAVAK